MVPSAPITPPPPMPEPEFGLGLHPNGHTQKLPGKSNLKQKPSTSYSGNGASSLEGREARFGEDGGERDQGERAAKVQWTDNHGQDLTQVFEFEPSSDSDDSEDDDDDSDLSHSCTCVIQ